MKSGSNEVRETWPPERVTSSGKERTFKQCSCGRRYSRPEWEALPLCGHIEGLESSLIELRNCLACGSTVAVGARWSESRERLISLLDG